MDKIELSQKHDKAFTDDHPSKRDVTLYTYSTFNLEWYDRVKWSQSSVPSSFGFGACCHFRFTLSTYTSQVDGIS